MLLTVAEFRDRVLGPRLPELIVELAEITGRRNPKEMEAWKNSFQRLAVVLDSRSLDRVHLYLGDRGFLSLEYRLPASSSWCDLVLLGNDGRNPNAVVVELKHWETRQDRALPHPGLIDRPSGLTLHPAEQVRGYVEYCRRFHSAFQDSKAVINGCVVFTGSPLNSIYCAAPNDALTSEYPCFGVATSHETSEALKFLNLRLVKPDDEFASNFEAGYYRQSRSFIQAVGATLKRSPHRRLELLDEQRKGFILALAAVNDAVSELSGSLTKRVVIVEGPPGSGKSAIAARLWAELAVMPQLPAGDLAFVTTSTAQNHSLEHLFGAGRGAVKKASHFVPSTTQELGRLKKRFPGQFDDVGNWRGNFDLLRKLKGQLDPHDNGYLISIVDEAHALINPESTDARGQFGFPVNFGPQGYHIIRGSVVSVFLLDEQQGFRERETTTRTDIEHWAAELGAEVLPVISLKEHQFRCGGAVEYLSWVDSLFSAELEPKLEALSVTWRKSRAIDVGTETLLAAEPAPNVIPFQNSSPRFAWELMDNPAELEAVLAAHARKGDSVRLLASYAREWKTEEAARPHELPPDMQDFYLAWENRSGRHTWSRIWNWKNAPQGYVGWIDPSPGVPMASNPLAEVGCPYTVRGFDYDYVGLLWLNDVIWRTDRWELMLSNVYESGLARHRQRAKRAATGGPEQQALLRKLLQGYRILLTRALKGVYVWCEDAETRRHLAASVG
ncbi:MAG TPA: DNA/RNA helicase domain-containing protein [Lacunisphaera sp.]|nr:DNA/RNA helicase domain-containing protein [Lacunisphaera sp.]